MFAISLCILFIAMISIRKTRYFALSFLPWFIFGISYMLMALYPNYKVNPIDVESLYHQEKLMFGVQVSDIDLGHAAEVCKGTASAIFRDRQLTPEEYFSIHHNAICDFIAGLFYLCWVPVPLLFAVYLYFSGRKEWARRFSWCFLFVNVLGFIGYYIHPASPPWYAMNYGFTPVLGTPGNTAGLGRWDAMTGLPVFDIIYGQNANVFAAVPSLHAAYLLITTVYAVMSRRKWYTCVLFGFICVGIWGTAVYTGHHYIIDVMLGIITAIIGIVIFEIFYRRTVLSRR
jgi:hypothetical protein